MVLCSCKSIFQHAVRLTAQEQHDMPIWLAGQLVPVVANAASVHAMQALVRLRAVPAGSRKSCRMAFSQACAQSPVAIELHSPALMLAQAHKS